MNLTFFERTQVFFAIVIAALIIGISIYLSFGIHTGQVASPADTMLANSNDSFIGVKMITKVIDGDTVIAEGESIRLLGIDADERGYPCYDEAKARLEELVLNKRVYLEEDVVDKDQYGRYLRYVILDGQNINLQMVEEGLAIARFSPENVKYKAEIIAAEAEAMRNKVGCKWGNSASGQTTDITHDFSWEKLTTALTGLDVIGSCNAGNFIGKEVIVEGLIADAYKSSTNTVFLNFDKPYPNQCFTSVIFSSNLAKFPENPEDYYKGKTVRVRGTVKEYQGKPEIILDSLSQIEVGT
ncbi:MAG: thermonuclease family protein [Candidatus Aenigmatarchaeota archaeon]